MIKDILLVAAGGAAGSVARYLLSRALQATPLASFPAGTMAANIIGCLAIGVICGLLPGGGTGGGQGLRLLLAVGFCGGFTTFSTFMNESLALLKGGNLAMCALYIGASVALGLLAVAGGWQLSKTLQA